MPVVAHSLKTQNYWWKEKWVNCNEAISHQYDYEEKLQMLFIWHFWKICSGCKNVPTKKQQPFELTKQNYKIQKINEK